MKVPPVRSLFRPCAFAWGRRRAIFAVLAGWMCTAGAALGGQTDGGPDRAPSSELNALAPQERASLQQFGLTFLLSSSDRTDSVATEVYLLQGETSEAWTQLLVYQRIMLPLPLATDRYVAWLQHQFASRPSPPRVRVLHQAKASTLFALHYPAQGDASEQISLALLTVADPKRPNELHLVQYVLCPARMAVEDMELHLRRWQARFQSQAASLDPGPG